MSTLKASVADQHKLLSLQEIDNSIMVARAEIKSLKNDEHHDQLRQQLARLQHQTKQAQADCEDAKKVLDAAENELSSTQTRQESLQHRLDAGLGSAKDLLALSTEIEQLDNRLLEQLEIEEQARANHLWASQQQAQVVQAQQELAQELAGYVEQLNERGQAASAKGKQQITQRAQLVAQLPEDLVQAYEQARSHNAGVGVGQLEGNTSTASGLPLAPSELAEIQTLAEDEVAFCPETEAILVRGK